MAGGFIRPGLQCEHCGLPFSLSLGAGVIGRREIEKLPDPFDATCPLCHQEATYPKSAIRALEAQPRQ